jgi:imidazolonepropionase-like amidohydrolase
MDADIILVKADPAAVIQALDQVAYTILGGRVIYRSSGLNNR